MRGRVTAGQGKLTLGQHLIEEQDHGSFLEVFVVANTLEDVHRLNQAVFLLVLVQYCYTSALLARRDGHTLIVLGDSGDEDNSGDAFKAVNPLPTLISLTANIKKLKVDVLDVESSFDNSTGAQTNDAHECDL